MIALEQLFHCFGTHESRTTVDTATAVEMLRTSGCRHLAINTHSIGLVSCGDDLPIGYGSATFGSVRTAFGAGELIPILNINMPTSSQEAIERACRAHLLTGERTIKLEVLDRDFRFSVNAAVIHASRVLINEGLNPWPLITPDPNTAAELEEMGCTLIRVMGSGIGSGEGLRPHWRESVLRTINQVTVPLMFDGGVGTPMHAVDALAMGFDSVLLNSCLFSSAGGPVNELRRFVALVCDLKARFSDLGLAGSPQPA